MFFYNLIQSSRNPIQTNIHSYFRTKKQQKRLFCFVLHFILHKYIEATEFCSILYAFAYMRHLLRSHTDDAHYRTHSTGAAVCFFFVGCLFSLIFFKKYFFFAFLTHQNAQIIQTFLSILMLVCLFYVKR